MYKYTCILLLFMLLNSCSVFNSVPQPEREFRGFWVATVVNIDWPKNGNDAVAKQKTDYLALLDFYEDLNFNAAIVQVRAAGDAFYESDFAPWSRFLTGEEGKPPKGDIAILEWMIDETHKRGMEFHAWLNPYRATFDLKTEVLSSEHDFNTHPEWMLKYGKKYYYDPGLPEVRKRMVSVIDEIVSNYDVDAVHFDDYFYPYTVKGEVFQDSLSFYNCALPNQPLDDWRRSNIDSLIKNSYETIKRRKPWVQFGVSPFGVWKNSSTDPKGSDTAAGQTTFEDLYADPLLWMEKGWLDYLIPQVYWSMELPAASHRKIVDWWAKNSKNTNLYIGNGPYKIRNNSDTAWDKKKELPSQLLLARKTDVVQGNAFFSAKSLMYKNDDVVKYLKRKYYKNKAFLPVHATEYDTKLSAPLLKKINNKSDSILLNFNDLTPFKFLYILSIGKKSAKNYTNEKIKDIFYVDNETSIRVPLKNLRDKNRFTILFVDKFGRESNPIVVDLKTKY